MAYTNGGVLNLTKKEKKNLLELIEHAERDISYGDGGTYGSGNEDFDEKAAKRVQDAIGVIRFILEAY